jgi:eukaryotic-like serine/threonine-protein kinase
MGSAQQPRSELQSLLQNRLRAFALLGLAATSVFLLKTLLFWDLTRPRSAAELFKADIAARSILVIAHAVVAGFLWGQRLIALRTLRLIEWVLLMLTAAQFAWTEYFWLRMAGTIVVLTPDALVFPWFGLLVAYGTLIPNTWRRCALAVGTLAFAPLAVVVGFSTFYGPVPFQPALLLEMAIRMAIGAAIALYSFSRIDELRQEAFAARHLGQYDLEKCLGSGGMGEVYLARHRLLRRPCAIKLIRPERAGDTKTMLRFEREVQVTARLTHWNTVEIFDYGHAEDGTFYYVMEYLPGLNLEELVQEYGRLPPERAVHLLRQVCQALQEAHAIGLIHRDIKPSNIISCERGGITDVAKLLDFGLVQDLSLGKDTEKLTLEGMVAGSPPYLSPEQALGKGNLDLRCDIYSLGAVAYFLLTGQPPFVRENAMRVLMAHVHDAVVRLTDVRADVPEDLQEVILRCLEKDPGKRFPDADSLEQSLANCQCANQWTRQKAANWWQEARPTADRSFRQVVVPSPAMQGSE